MAEKETAVCVKCYIEWDVDEMTTPDICDLCHDLWEMNNQE